MVQVIPPNADPHAAQFSFTVWPRGTKAMLARVPWGSDYRDIVKFDSQTDLDTYLMMRTGKTISFDKMSYLKAELPITVPTPFNEVYEYNYMRVWNDAAPITGDKPRVFYYFINGVEYAAPNATVINVQLDVWSTFGYDIKFGNAFIEQGHAGIAAENAFDEYGRNFLSAPEGLDVGNEYRIINTFNRYLTNTRDNALASQIPSILVTSSVDLRADPGDVNAPKLVTATGNAMENLPNGAGYYVFNTPTDFSNWLANMKDKPWVTQGIMAVMAIPNSSIYGPDVNPGTGIQPGTPKAGQLRKVKTPLQANWRTVGDPTIYLNNGRYARLKKFLTFPYCILELTSNAGTPLVLKPEAWRDPDMTVIEVPHFASASPRLMFYPLHYNGSQYGSDEFDPIHPSEILQDGAEHYDMMTGITNFPTFSVVNNGYMSFLASNRNSIAFQHSSADWSQQKALAGNQLSFDQASANMGLSQDLTNAGVQASRDQTQLANDVQVTKTIIGAGQSVIGGAVSGAAAGPPGAIAGAAMGAANAAMSGINAAVDITARNASNTISTGLALRQNSLSVGNAAYMRDTNKAYADFAAKGDYSQAIAGINARVQDAKMTQPTTSGQIGGDAFNLATFRWGYMIKVKMVHDFAMRTIGEYWLRFGYRLGFFIHMPDDLRLMQRFTFWKLKECYITSARCPEPFKQVIRGIFESGVTVWNDPADIGTIDIADNAPKPGFRL